jgi:hypothetical protein
MNFYHTRPVEGCGWLRTRKEASERVACIRGRLPKRLDLGRLVGMVKQGSGAEPEVDSWKPLDTLSVGPRM